jgi:flagellar hook assembly protein FlgD
VKLRIYNILGQEILTLSEEAKPAGYFVATWDGANRTGAKVSSGVYFYRMEATSTAGDQTFTSLKKMVLLK